MCVCVYILYIYIFLHLVYIKPYVRACPYTHTYSSKAQKSNKFEIQN